MKTGPSPLESEDHVNGTPSASRVRKDRYATLLFLSLIVAGLMGNYFPFSIVNAHFVFGSVFAMLALQIFGWGRGVLAAAVISGYTYLAWNHPWAIVTMTGEVAVVGWFMTRNKLTLVSADALYWFFIGIPLGYFCFHGISDLSASNSLFLMTKQTINGITNALFARMIFYGYSLRLSPVHLPFREVISNVLLLFLLCPVLTLLALGGKTAMAESDHNVRATVYGDSRKATESLKRWLEDRKRAVTTLAQMAGSLPQEQMQERVDQARTSDPNFLRIKLMDKEAKVIAHSPLNDELGRSNLGKSFADRPYVPLLKQGLKPMLSEVMISRIDRPDPIAIVLAPVIRGEEYEGAVGGILNFDRIEEILRNSCSGFEARYTLLDRNSNVILTNCGDRKLAMRFSRGRGSLNYLDQGLSQWIPELPPNTSAIELWGKSLFLNESAIGDLAEWKLILEQPVAPFQKRIYDAYVQRFFLLSVVLIAAFLVSEFLSRRIVATIEQLRLLTHDLPGKVALDSPILWPASTIQETSELIANVRGMADMLRAKFAEMREVNRSLEERVRERTEALRQSQDVLKEANLKLHESQIATLNVLEDRQAENKMRKLNEEALLDAQKRLRRFIDSNIVGVVIATPSGEVIEANDYYLRLIGSTRQEFERGIVDWRGITPPEWLPADEKAIEELRERGTCTPYEKEYVLRDGTRVWVFLCDVMLPRPEEQIAAFVLDITESKRAKDDLARSREELRKLSAHLIVSMEQERRRIARDIHDELGQVLTALKMDLFWLKSRLSKDRHEELVKKIMGMSMLLQGTSKSLKRMCSELRPDLLEEFGLVAAMQSHAEEFQNRFGSHCVLEFESEDLPIGKEAATALFRIFQEALTNVAQHSQATEVRIAVGEKEGHLCLSIRDNGVGFDPTAGYGSESFGLIGMKERTHIVGGEFNLETSPNQGTRIEIRIPIDQGGQ